MSNEEVNTPLYPGKAGKSSFCMLNSWFCWRNPTPCLRVNPARQTTHSVAKFCMVTAQKINLITLPNCPCEPEAELGCPVN